MLCAIAFARDGNIAWFYLAAALAPAAFIFDVFDGKVARSRHQHSAFGRELDSLADVISFGVAPAALGFAAGLSGWLDWIALVYFVCCGVSRLARFNVTAESLSAGGDKVKYFEGTPIPTSVVIVGLARAGCVAGTDRGCHRGRRVGHGPAGAASVRAALRPVGIAHDQQDAADPEVVRPGDYRYRAPAATSTFSISP